MKSNLIYTLAVSLIIFTAACTQKSEVTSGASQKGGISIPGLLLAAEFPADAIVTAYLYMDPATANILLAEKVVDLNDGKTQMSFASISVIPGLHIFKIEFTYQSQGIAEIAIASFTTASIDLQPGSSTPINIGTDSSPWEYPNSDNDGIPNINEILDGTNPRVNEEDVTAPAVVGSFYPLIGGNTFFANSQIAINFSEALDVNTVSSNTFKIIEEVSLNAVPGTVAYIGSPSFTAVFTPDVPFQVANYTAIINADIKDIAGNNLELGATLIFSIVVDSTSPTVMSSTPSANTINVSLYPGIRIDFSEAIDPTSVTNTSVVLTELSPPNTIPTEISTIVGINALIKTQLVMTPTDPLKMNVSYNVNLNASIRDLAGNSLSGGYSLNFTTAFLGHSSADFSAALGVRCDSCHNDITATGISVRYEFNGSVQGHSATTNDCAMCHSPNSYLNTFIDHSSPSVTSAARCDNCHNGSGARGKDSSHLLTSKDCAVCHVPGSFLKVITVVEQAIAYVQRPTPLDGNNTLIENDLRDPVEFRPGAHLIVKNIASLSAAEIDITTAIIGDTGDVRDPEFNFDGSRLVFSLRMQNDNSPPMETWDIYEYIVALPISQAFGSKNPRRVMIINDASLGHDIGPAYLPGDRIVFSSTRAKRTRVISVKEGATAFSPTIEARNSDVLALNLHIMNVTDGGNIQQLTFNMSHDLDPTFIRNILGLEGHIIFTRWENSPGRNQMSIYAMRPDGTSVIHLYGAHSNNLGTAGSAMQFSQPHETFVGDVLVLGRAFTNTQDGGDPVVVNVSAYVDNTSPSNANPAGIGPGQVSVSNGSISTDSTLSLQGRYASVVPILDGTNRALASFSKCFVDFTDSTLNRVVNTRDCNDPLVDLTNDPKQSIAPPRYGVYVLDINTNLLSPITAAVPNVYYTDLAIAQGYATDGVQLDSLFDIITTPKTGTLHIRSVYDLDGVFDPLGSTAARLADLIDPAISTNDPVSNPAHIERPAHFLRIVKGTYLPDNNVKDYDRAAYGMRASGQLMRQIVGYAPIEPDGSVRIDVPSDVPLSFSILDKDGHRIGARHNNWVTVRPGEELSCHGCHDHASGNPHGRQSATSPQIDAAAPALNSGANASLSFPNSVNTYAVTINATMAYVRTEAQGKTPSVNMNYTDNWTDPVAANRPIDAATTSSYNTISTASPLNRAACSDVWDESCRIIINYPTHIQPIWELLRIDSNFLPRHCTSCHSTYDAGSGFLQIPLGKYELDLSTILVDTQYIDYNTSYVELLGPDNQLELLQGANLVDALFNDGFVDGGGNPILTPRSVFRGKGISEIINSGQANRSDPFFEVFTEAYYKANIADAARTPHWDPGANNGAGEAWLTPGELKLISEWIDIGAQYYNDPFTAPLN